jgi:hypothetical protein
MRIIPAFEDCFSLPQSKTASPKKLPLSGTFEVILAQVIIFDGACQPLKLDFSYP